MTVAPSAFAIITADSPTPPAPAWTNTHSPGCVFALTTRPPYEVGIVTYKPAASSKLQPSGIGSSEVSGAKICVAYAPCDDPNTLSPTLNLCEVCVLIVPSKLLATDEPVCADSVGVAITTPANSAPAIHGRGG